MPKKTKNKTQGESPILAKSYSREEWEDARTEYAWCCVDELAELFELGDATRIFLVAKAQADRYSYHVKVDSFGYLIEPRNRIIFDTLSTWLAKQIAAGRPNIGVRIIQ